jgi:regulator of protease activity HflC (stomatin/prohibitin superfamily)
MSAERLRRAVIIEAEGTRKAAVTVAEGEKEAAILNAEGKRQSEILSAEGDQQAAILRAEGFSNALARIENIAKDVSPNAMSLQYFETLKSMGEGEATKYIFPLEFTNLLNSFIQGRDN